MLKPNQTVLPIVTKLKTTRSEPAAEKLPVFGAGLEVLEVMDCVSGGLTPMGPSARDPDPRSTHPAAAGVAASIGISNFGLDLRRA